MIPIITRDDQFIITIQCCCKSIYDLDHTIFGKRWGYVEGLFYIGSKCYSKCPFCGFSFNIISIEKKET